ncbi:MAG: hybrid sensor histidine kinase/response regulator, partial [Candidatus Rokuibacteriota bacterium]
LGLGADPGTTFSRDELQTLEALADQAALAFENARLYASARDSLVRLRETQAQLVQAAKMSALGQLVSGVAHELNNPLSVIIGYGQLLLSRDVPEALRRPVELMVAQGDRMAKIVRNLLYFARQRPAERVHMDLNQVLEQTLALRFNQLLLSGIRVEKAFAPELPGISGDSSQLEQVFLNLLLNAEQAILEVKSEGVITLRTRPDASGTVVIAEVIDDGPGIAAELLPRVFEPFFTTKTVGTGTGLGLSVSYGIVEEHGGRLTVQSEPGRTVFALELPAARPSSRTEAPADHRRHIVSGGGRAALVVEDEQPVRDLIAATLLDTGWQVDMADGGHAALERVRARQYDLIVSDLKMAEGSGPEFYQRTRAHDPLLAGRFIFITGDTANADLWAFLEGAEVPVIEKPFHPALFEEAVWRLIAYDQG